MRKMKDSGIEWIGEIPEDWDVHRLAGLGEFSGSGNDKKINPDEPTVKMINYVDVYNNKTYELNADIDYMTVSCPENKYSELLVQKGDLIFTPSSETIDDIGISALVVDDLKNTVYSYHVLRYRANEKVDFSFKKYLCNNHYARNYFSSKAVGTVRKTLNRDDFKNLKIALPLIEAQAKIAIYLDKKCAEIDAIIAAKEKTNELLKERRQSIIYEAVTKGLDPTVPMKDSGIEWIGEIPESWGFSKLKYDAYMKGRIGWQGLKADEFIQEGPYLVTGTDFEDGKVRWERSYHISEERFNEAPEIQLKEQDLLITKDGTIGKLAYIDYLPGLASLNSHLLVIRPKRERFLNKYLYWVLSSDVFFQYTEYAQDGTIMASLSQEKISQFVFGLPSIEEQQLIANYLDEQCAEIDSLIAANESTIEKLKEYRQSVIYEAVTGKVEI